jgi:glycosyltransferase involved in cell wall biosynthesis
LPKSERSVVVVRAWPGQPSVDALVEFAESGERPRTPYVELARGLDADVLDYEFLTQRGSKASRVVGRRMTPVEGEVLEAFLRRNQYRHIVAFADRIGLELALLMKLARSRRDLFVVSNWMTGASKRPFLERAKVQSHIGTIIGRSVQLDLVAKEYAIDPSRLHATQMPVDERFWTPSSQAPEDLICSVGCVSGFRDYKTLVAAARGLDVRFELAVGSLILSEAHKQQRARLFRAAIPEEELPPNVSYEFDLSRDRLRDLYARSRFVVMPLEDVDFDAGVTSITEAMAMGKAVIVTRNRGQVDVVDDGVEGIYVPPYDAGALREAIVHLLENPAEAERMGAAGRARVLERHTIETYVRRVVGIVQNGHTPPDSGS